MEINEKHLERLVNDQRRIDANLEMHKNKFIKEMRGGLGEKIKEEIKLREVNIGIDRHGNIIR